MRVTTLGSTNNSVAWMKVAAERMATGQRQVATGVRFESVSESPSDGATILRSRRSLDRLEQLERNTTNAKLWLETGDTALNGAVTSLTRARTLTVQGANGINTPEARAAIAGDIRSIADELISIANTSINGRAIFGGTSGASGAFDASGLYQGDGGQVLRNVTPGDSFVVAVPGPEIFGTANGPDPLNGTVFQMLNAVADSIEAGDPAGARLGIEAVDAAIGRIQGEVGRLGNLASRLDGVIDSNQSSQIATRSQISMTQDVDMGEAIVRLRAAETSYQATLSATGRTLGRSLLDFLR